LSRRCGTALVDISNDSFKTFQDSTKIKEAAMIEITGSSQFQFVKLMIKPATKTATLNKVSPKKCQKLERSFNSLLSFIKTAVNPLIKTPLKATTATNQPTGWLCVVCVVKRTTDSQITIPKLTNRIIELIMADM